MNERIKELAEQAGFNSMGIWNIIGIQEYHEKFAELIVKDVLGCYTNIDNGNTVEGTDDFVKAVAKRYDM
jgi:hypothetical protein